MSIDIAAIKARADAASEGPWTVDGSYVRSDAHHIADLHWLAQDEDELAAMLADAEFIAHARTDVPDLLAEVERLTAELTELTRDRDEFFDEICRLIPDEYDDDAAVEGIVLRWAKDQVEGRRKVRAAHQPCRFGPEQCTICAVLDGDEAP